MNVMRHLFWFLCAAAIAACESQPEVPPEAYLIQARARLSSDIQQCSRTYRYDPDSVAGLPERALAPGELLWHQCAYEAMRNYEEANPPLAPLYNSFIEQDVLLTNGLMQGQMTRSQRRTKIVRLLARIKTAEQEQIDGSRAEEEKKKRQVRNMYDLFRSFGYGAVAGVRGS